MTLRAVGPPGVVRQVQYDLADLYFGQLAVLESGVKLQLEQVGVALGGQHSDA